jgi:hypothetical protein
LLPGCRRIFFSRTSKAGWLISIVLLTSQTASSVGKTSSRVFCREDLKAQHLNQLSDKLRKITGWTDLGFDQEGALRLGIAEPVGGSNTARELLEKISTGVNVVIIEDASKRSDVVFCRVVPGKWKGDEANRPPVYVVLIDFADFEQLMGDRAALSAFDVGWGLMHELDHVVNDSHDSASLGKSGECEDHINQMRRECNLPVRADYFFTLFPVSGNTDFQTRLVRLPFEQSEPGSKKKRYWLLWDASAVGFGDANQIAATKPAP